MATEYRKEGAIVAQLVVAGRMFFLLILVIIFLRYYFFGIRAVLTPKKKLFCYCLLSAGASILLNILTVFTLSGPAGVPQWLNMLLNSGYFLLTGGTCTLFALFLFRLTLEHVYDPHCTRSPPPCWPSCSPCSCWRSW